VTHGGTATRAAKKAGKTIPVVFAVMSDPVGRRIVKSLARPGGNITGMATLSRELPSKRLELLKEVVPSVSRVAFLYKSGRKGRARMKNLQAVATWIGVRILPVKVKGPDDFGPAFDTIQKERAEAFVIQGSGLMASHYRQITAFALKSRLPSIYGLAKYAEAGGLLAYGPDFNDMYRRAATYVYKILKGTNPADLPVEQPRKFNLTINLKTAKKIGVTIPPEVLLRATKVIK
jgi:putative ABC transport system substrate-binding protein